MKFLLIGLLICSSPKALRQPILGPRQHFGATLEPTLNFEFISGLILLLDALNTPLAPLLYVLRALQKSDG